MDGGAYGAGPAGAPFNPVAFIKKPQVIVRLVALVRHSTGYVIHLEEMVMYLWSTD